MAMLVSSFFRCVQAILLLSSCTNPTPTSNHAAPAPPPDNETDLASLLTFKAGIDPTGALGTWDERVHFCRWSGVVCGLHEPDRVVALELASSRLGGHISPAISNLTFLRVLNLSNNSLNGVLHPELGRLRSLRILDLSRNELSGEIPANLSCCPHLQQISLKHNRLTGKIPAALGSLSSLRNINVHTNNLSGEIPPTLGNLSSLVQLNLGRNSLTGGIPPELGRLTELETFAVLLNNLSGQVPPSIYNLSKATIVAVAHNNLYGMIPSDIGTRLPKLESLLLSRNHFVGPIPSSLPNASSLRMIEFLDNRLTGTVPANLGGLRSLSYFYVGGDHLEARKPAHWNFLTSLTNCTQLKELSIDENQLEGALPNSISNFSTSLRVLLMGTNRISGSIPEEMKNLEGLQRLSMEENQLSGNIPSSLGKLKNLVELYLSFNRLSGEIPPALGNITNLNTLDLAHNRLVGSIPRTFGNYGGLKLLDMSGNALSGIIPVEISKLITTTVIHLHGNSLVGSLPPKLGGLKNLVALDLSRNRLSGELPRELGGLQIMQHLSLAGNFFGGAIPPCLGDLKALEDLDLSLNNFTGGIPATLGELGSLYHLNLSFNNLGGPVPGNGVFANVTGVSITGNQNLCGGTPALNLPACPTYGSIQNKTSRMISCLLKLVIPAVLLLILIICPWVYHYRMKKTRGHTAAALQTLEHRYNKISYTALQRATNGFSPCNLIGTGSSGCVYRGILEEHAVAIKVLNLRTRGASKSFLAECEVLKNARHRNLVKIVTACSSIDSTGASFKALVFEYMPNGTLHEWLHPEGEADVAETPPLDFQQRLSIAIDVAAALDYLHNHCHSSPIVHCDVKPSNVLLDDEMTAHVGDFGLARFLPVENPSQKQLSTVRIKGTVGYVAPEYGLGGPVSTFGDVYGFGILLLELFTGKRPTDDLFKDGVCLRVFVHAALPDRVVDIVDPRLSIPKDEQGATTWWSCFISLMTIGLTCSEGSPEQRMLMGDVLSKIKAIGRRSHVIQGGK